jgi:5-methylcytosine-specific restriction endonuclease McrA
MAKKILLRLEDLPRTRAEARGLGSKWFFTGKPCKRGHLAARHVSSATCMECHLARQLAQYQLDPEPTKGRAVARYYQLKATDPDGLRIEGRKKSRAWRAANPDKALALSRRIEAATRPTRRAQERARYAANPAKHLQKVRKYRAANPDYATASNLAWRRRNPEAAKANHANKRARQKNAEGRHTAADIRRIRAAQNDRCAICDTDLNKKGHVDHKVPLSRGGTNWPDNIQILCQPCNQKKWAHRY